VQTLGIQIAPPSRGQEGCLRNCLFPGTRARSPVGILPAAPRQRLWGLRDPSAPNAAKSDAGCGAPTGYALSGVTFRVAHVPSEALGCACRNSCNQYRLTEPLCAGRWGALPCCNPNQRRRDDCQNRFSVSICHLRLPAPWGCLRRQGAPPRFLQVPSASNAAQSDAGVLEGITERFSLLSRHAAVHQQVLTALYVGALVRSAAFRSHDLAALGVVLALHAGSNFPVRGAAPQQDRKDP
jgi:hypothetical protein